MTGTAISTLTALPVLSMPGVQAGGILQSTRKTSWLSPLSGEEMIPMLLIELSGSTTNEAKTFP